MVAQLNPSVLDNYDFDAAERTAALTDGVPPEFLRPEDARDEMRAARAEAEAAAQQQEQAMMMADAAAKVGKVPAESPVGQAVNNALQAA